MVTILSKLQDKYPQFILTKSETAKELRTSEPTIDRLRKQGKIKSKKIGGRVFFKVDEVAAFLDA